MEQENLAFIYIYYILYNVYSLLANEQTIGCSQTAVVCLLSNRRVVIVAMTHRLSRVLLKMRISVRPRSSRTLRLMWSKLLHLFLNAL